MPGGVVVVVVVVVIAYGALSAALGRSRCELRLQRPRSPLAAPAGFGYYRRLLPAGHQHGF
ncbi:hypothetical protein CKO42_20535 [Lamprobacter modestohalophilus]|uniref:Uncharacterized protein n=1 Tax=Lamprobacter modestohalophilus TaxID=1064514 RepID=A0A9X1B5Q3_9GAMM|nr:hypothetical protein [Lamprobacter modestohalophilus]